MKTINHSKNWNCEGIMCYDSSGEVRILPTGEDSNAILCGPCFDNEMEFRRDRNKTLGGWAQFKIPKWEDLKVYEGA